MRDQGMLPYTIYPPGVQIRIPSFREYFSRYGKRTLGSRITIVGLIAGFFFAAFIGIVPLLRGDPHADTLLGFLVFLAIVLLFPIVYAVNVAFLAFQSVQRVPLLYSLIDRTYVWLFVDLAAPYVEVFATCEQLVRKFTREQPSQVLASDGANGVLVCETPLSFPNNAEEINFRLERFWSRDTELPYEITRVQILSRPIASWIRASFSNGPSSDPYFAKESIRALKEKYPLLAEGPGENLQYS